MYFVTSHHWASVPECTCHKTTYPKLTATSTTRTWRPYRPHRSDTPTAITPASRSRRQAESYATDRPWSPHPFQHEVTQRYVTNSATSLAFPQQAESYVTDRPWSPHPFQHDVTRRYVTNSATSLAFPQLRYRMPPTCGRAIGNGATRWRHIWCRQNRGGGTANGLTARFP